MIKTLSPAPDDFAFAVEHCDIEGDLRSTENLRRRLPGSLGDELTDRYPALFGLLQHQQRRIGVAAEFYEIGRRLLFPQQFLNPDAVDAAGLGVKIEQSLSEFCHLGKATGA